MSTRVLILGGTTEAARLASCLAVTRPDLEVTTSLAGATGQPAAISGRLRVGGFGGVEGLVAWLRDERIDLLVDATHPFAATMARHAAEAAAATGTPRLKLLRPMWPQRDGDRWIEVDDAAGAARAVGDLGARAVFLTLGRRELDAFAPLAGVRFVVRMIEPPSAPLPLDNAALILARGPFGAADESALLAEHGIDALVAKASGGAATEGKIVAARQAGLPVVMIRRPAPPDGETVEDVDAALAWIDAAA